MTGLFVLLLGLNYSFALGNSLYTEIHITGIGISGVLAFYFYNLT